MLKMTVRNRLIFAFLAILLLPCSAIGWFSYQSAAKKVTEEIEHNAEQAVQAADSQITDLMSGTLADLDYLAGELNSNMADGDASPQVRTILDQYKAVNPQFDMVFLGLQDGLMLRSPEQKVEGYDPRKRGWYIKGMEKKGTAIMNPPSVSASSGKIVVIPSKSISDSSGVVGGNLSLEKLSERVSSFSIGKKGYVYALDADRKYLVHPTSKLGEVKTDAYVDKFYAASSGTVNYQLKGVAKRAVFATNELTGWKLIGTIEMSEIAAATQGILYTTLIVMAVSVLIGALLVVWIIRSITIPLKTMMLTTEKIAEGDLTKEIEIRSKDELGQLSESVNNMVHNLRDLIGNVVSSSQNVAAASQQISATTEEIAGGSSAQAQAAQGMQETFSELAVAINSVAVSADEAAKLAAKTTSIAQDGGQIVQKSVESMNQVSLQMARLEEDSNKIGEIIEVIDDIAEQTNLLALNAAIEAARAGDQGRGFAVVADEVRKLAERSGEATKQITTIIKGMQQNTHLSVVAVSDGVQQSRQTGQAFEKIIGMINETEHKVSEIAAASEEQSAQSNEVMRSIESISSASEEAAAASEETAATSQTLANLAESLNHSVSIFKVK